MPVSTNMVGDSKVGQEISAGKCSSVTDDGDTKGFAEAAQGTVEEKEKLTRQEVELLILCNGNNEKALQNGAVTKDGKMPMPEPKDPFHFVSITIFLFGIGSLLPWNFFITANDYWMYKFRDVTQEFNPTTNRTALQADFSSYLAIASKVPYIFFLVVNTALSQRIRPSKRIGYPLFACILLFIVSTVLVKVNTDGFQHAFLGITLAIVVLINMVCAFLQGGGTGVAGCFPAKYMALMVYGMAAGGVFATAAQILTLLLDSTPTDSALLYFSLAIVTLVFTQICFIVLMRTEFYKHYMSTQAVCYEVLEKETDMKKPKLPMMEIFVKGWHYYVSAALIFWITLSVFPAVVVLTVSTNVSDGSPFTNKYFIPLACFTTFNLTDLIGRLLSGWFPIPARMKNTILFFAIGRIVFVPLTMLCNSQPRHLLPVVFHSDAAFIVIMCLFGLTNGYLATITLTYASKSVSTEYQEVAGSLAAVFLGLGLMLGSLSSYGTVKLL